MQLHEQTVTKLSESMDRSQVNATNLMRKAQQAQAEAVSLFAKALAEAETASDLRQVVALTMSIPANKPIAQATGKVEEESDRVVIFDVQRLHFHQAACALVLLLSEDVPLAKFDVDTPDYDTGVQLKGMLLSDSPRDDVEATRAELTAWGRVLDNAQVSEEEQPRYRDSGRDLRLWVTGTYHGVGVTVWRLVDFPEETEATVDTAGAVAA